MDLVLFGGKSFYDMDLKYLFEANNTPCVLSCINTLSSVQPPVFGNRNTGER